MRAEASSEFSGVYVLHFDAVADVRGTFVKYFDAVLFREIGLCERFAQAAAAQNPRAGTIRGLHYQAPPQEEVKIVRCTRGEIFDVIVDVREGSPTRGRWQSFVLREGTHDGLYVGAGFAHGYQTLVDDCEVEYLISAPHEPELQRGIHWQSELLGIPWPLPPSAISRHDAAFAEFA